METIFFPRRELPIVIAGLGVEPGTRRRSRPKSQTYVLVTAIDGAELTRAADQMWRAAADGRGRASGAVP